MTDMQPHQIVSTPPFSSNDPSTDGLRMQLVDPGQNAAQAADSSSDADKKASDWKEEVEAAVNQDQLDEIAQRYEASGADFKTVEDAIDAKQKELDAQAGH